MEPPDIPRTLGRYQLLARIATGGMGEVFLARLEGAAGFEKLYAVKRILPHLASEERFRSMLIAEAQIAARMSHPNICQVYELGESNGQLYIAMEYLEGTSLDGLLRAQRAAGGALDLGCIATIFRQTCDALHHAHELRDREGAALELVHRDVSPGNIFVCTTGGAKVLDFGIAKVKHGAQTQTGTVKGKYAYMAPEQLRGGALSRQVDVFALGAVLFEMLALRRLFQRETDYLTFRAVLEDPLPDLRRYRPDASEALVAVIAKALAREPAERWATARELCDAALAALATTPWGEERVAALVTSAMASDLAHTNDAIKTVMARAGAPVADGEPPITNVSAPDLPAVDVAATTIAPAPVHKRSRAPIWIALAALVIAGGALGAVALTRERKSEPPVVIQTDDASTRDSDLKAVVPYMKQLDHCASKHPTKLAETTASILIGTDGRMTTTTFDQLEGTELASCMLGVLREVPFKARNNESLLSLTIRFQRR